MIRILALLLVALAARPLLGAADGKPRLVVLTDIGGDPDDQQSMIRLMAYANEFEIEGLIASASGVPGQLKENVVRPDLIREIVRAYGQVRPNLVRHAAGYPSEKQLLDVIRAGSPVRGEGAIGANGDTEGSRHIIALVDRTDPRPVNLTIWGGPTDLAQALWRVRNDRSEAAVKRFVSKLRVHAIGHQDDNGPWILAHFPDLFYVLSAADPDDVTGRPQRGKDRRLSVYRGMYLGGDESLTSREWVTKNVKENHGPLGALYPMKTHTNPNPHGVLKEGDTPSWFYFLRNGLSDPEHPEQGGWGGRFVRLKDNVYNDAPDADPRVSVSRWRPHFQNAFAARMDWAAAPDRRAANHPPKSVLNGDVSLAVLTIEAKPGQRVQLSAGGSSDPDGNSLAYRWYEYSQPEQAAASQMYTVAAPSAPGVLDIVLEVTDDGTPALTSYRRALIRVSK